MNRVAVFLGPSLDRASALAVLPQAELLPPVAQGDVLRAVARGCQSLVVIDGVFEQTPAVWHKELLFAMSQGVRVIGAASMGALRAAELDRFGMEGVGWVYRQYAEGLRDDDEVALLHTDAELGYANLSVPMIQVRHVLAHSPGDDPACKALAALADEIKARFYPGRTVEWLHALLLARGHGRAVADAVLTRLTAAEYSVKRADALLALARAQEAPAALALPVPQTLTVFMQRLVRSLGQASEPPPPRQWLAQALAAQPEAPAAPLAQQLVSQWQRRQGLPDRTSVEQFLALRSISKPDFFAFFKACARLHGQAQQATTAQRERTRAFTELI
ncbi:tfuA protein [Pelomonas sp. HMWF004]|nr:tfuA protein [Pelomonas sp. HMWF004]